MKHRNVAICILLSIVTCGIYGLYWLYTIADAFAKEQTQEHVGTSPGITLLLCIVTCNIYAIYCFYKWGKASAEIAERHGQNGCDRAIIYLILSIIGLNIVNMALVQNDFNNWLNS